MFTIVYTFIRPVSVIPFFHEIDMGGVYNEFTRVQALTPGFIWYNQLILSPDRRTSVFNSQWQNGSRFDHFSGVWRNLIIAMNAIRDEYHLNHGITMRTAMTPRYPTQLG